MTDPVGQGCPLTNMEIAIVELLASGLTYKQIALQTGSRLSTIRSHLHNVYGKLGVHDRAQAVLLCERSGWIDSPGADPAAVLLLRLARATEELCALIRARSKLTDPQREYLSAFDSLLWARTDDDKATARESMENALGVVLPAGGGDRDGRRRRDLLELLVDYVERHRGPA